jgi:hypothetical protein
VAWNAKRKLFEPVLLEEHVLREIVGRLWLQAKIKMWRINQPVGGKTRQNEAGIPDLMGWVSYYVQKKDGMLCKHTVPLFIEVKRPGGARRPAQIRFIDEAKAGGCVAGFCESWEDVVKLLRPLAVVTSEVSK